MRNLVLEETLAGCFPKLGARSGNLTKSLEAYFWILCLFLTLKTFSGFYGKRWRMAGA